MSSNNKIQPVSDGNKLSSQSDPVRPKRRFSVPGTITESFEWVVSGGRSARTLDVPIFLGLQAIIALFLIMGPYYILKLSHTDLSWEKLIFKDEDLTGFDQYDIVRLSSALGFGWFVFVVFMAFLHFLSKLIKMTRRRDHSLHLSAQKFLETIGFLGPYISMTLGVIAAAFLVKRFYPQGADLGETLSAEVHHIEATTTGTPVAPTEPGPPIEGAPKAENEGSFENLLKAFIKTFNFFKVGDYKILYFKNIFPIIVNTLTLFVLVLTFEKFILQMITVQYRTATTGGRFTDNAFALSLLKSLYRTMLDKSLAKTKPGRSFDADLTNSLFDALVSDSENENENENLTVKNLEKIMNAQQAAKLFSMLDIAQNEDLNKEEFLNSVKAIYDEQQVLSKLVVDHNDIISKLDGIMMFAVYSIDLALCLTFLGIPGLDMLKAIFGLIVAVGVVFGDALMKVFDSLVFVLVTHPYDLGDRVEIGGKYLYVESVGLWTTIFEGPGGLNTIMTNASLSNEMISNFRRSPAENEVFSYLVRPETVTDESVRALKEDCMQFFKDNRRDFLATWYLETSDQIDSERFKIIIKVFHRENFQDEKAKNKRSKKFALYFKDALIRNGFVFSPALQKAILANF